MDKPKIYILKDGGSTWCCCGSGYSLNGYGSTPREAYVDWKKKEVKIEISRQKAFRPQTEKITINVDEVFEESHRIVMDEVMRIGNKVLPVILALVAGFLIGRLYG